MVTYVIASKATQPFLPECQMLGELLEQNCPDVTVKVVIKSNEDWGEYIDAVSKTFQNQINLYFNLLFSRA